jgi:signal transduction histidine kinase
MFGSATVATGLVFSLDLAPALGANPAYATTLLLGCVAPLWPRRLLIAVLVPVHLLYLAMVFLLGQGVVFVLLMAIGGTVAAALGWFVAVLQLRTERYAFETAATIRRQKERVEHLLGQRSEMVATVAHDLQSPLAGIRALLRMIPEDAKLREIARTCAAMQDAITRLLDAHATESDDVALEPVDLGKLFKEVAAAAIATAAEKGISIVHDASGLRVEADSLLLARALGNLVSNAVKFSPRGSQVRITAQAKGDCVRVAVIDQGPGVPAAERPALFTKFARLSAQPTGSESTSGLGLYIVQSLAARMQGSAGYEPDPTGGSIFFIDLPAARR